VSAMTLPAGTSRIRRLRWSLDVKDKPRIRSETELLFRIPNELMFHAQLKEFPCAWPHSRGSGDTGASESRFHPVRAVPTGQAGEQADATETLRVAGGHRRKADLPSVASGPFAGNARGGLGPSSCRPRMWDTSGPVEGLKYPTSPAGRVSAQARRMRRAEASTRRPRGGSHPLALRCRRSPERTRPSPVVTAAEKTGKRWPV
jgi:hypothetical protein